MIVCLFGKLAPGVVENPEFSQAHFLETEFDRGEKAADTVFDAAPEIDQEVGP